MWELGLDLWERALQGYLSKLDASRSGLGVKWHFHIFTEKALRTRKYLFTPCLEPTEILAFFCYACVLFLSFFLFSLYFLTSALLRGNVSTRRTDAQAQMKMSSFTQTDTRTFNMYRSRKRTTASSIPTDSGGLTVHPLVALWSSSVKVYALSHVGKGPCGLFLLSSMIHFAGCWCLSSVL